MTGIPAPRPVPMIDLQLSATATRRAAVKAAIRRRCDDIVRAEADVLNYERQLAALDGEIDALFDERARAQITAQIEQYAG